MIGYEMVLPKCLSYLSGVKSYIIHHTLLQDRFSYVEDGLLFLSLLFS
jgi:hypothetical protein